MIATGGALLTFALGGMAAAGVIVGGDNNGTVTLGQTLVVEVSDSVPGGNCSANTLTTAHGHAGVGPLGPAEGGSGWQSLSVSCSGDPASVVGTWNYSGAITVTVPQDAGSSVWVSVAVQEWVPTYSGACACVGLVQGDYNFNHTYPVTSPSTTTTNATTTTTVVGTTTTPAGTTTTTPATPPPTVTTTVTTTVTQPATTTTAAVTPVEQSLQDQINALSAQIAALTDRVTRIEKAGDAAWLAFEQAVGAGATTAEAAAIARGTYLNAEYGLGEFAS